MRWTGDELDDTDDDVFAGPYFDLSQLTAEGARALLDAAPVEVERIEYAAGDGGRVRATPVG